MLLDKEHPFIPPTTSDSRSLCPVLNALANHGYLKRDGMGVTPQEIATALHRGLGLSITLAHSMSANAFISDTIPSAKNYPFNGVFTESETKSTPRMDLAEIWSGASTPAESCGALFNNLHIIKEHDETNSQGAGIHDRSEGVPPPPYEDVGHAPRRDKPFRIGIHELYEADLMRENPDDGSLEKLRIYDTPHSNGLRKWELFVMAFADSGPESNQKWINSDTLALVLRDQKLPEPVSWKVRCRRNLGSLVDLEGMNTWILGECRRAREGSPEAGGEGATRMLSAIRKLGPVWWRR
ncbi:hypothetical protein BD410DRAFT_64612 [Rickenella mellea]|uniref:Heme haloperoxidase family profile domain-containing protein n=1 Tax=Rickenella mellea TaxID=50990 RepID=A0A4Y7QB86_9AGAM|nr:hypothetical protein BD410DRAFT_64612 [Rickenella mellea]